MRKRRLLILGLLPLLLFAGYLALWLTSPKHRIDRQGYGKIQLGMTEEEVEDILGAPAGNHAISSLRATEELVMGETSHWLDESKCTLKTWVSDSAEIGIWFSEDGKVMKTLAGFRPDNFFGKLRQWLGL